MNNSETNQPVAYRAVRGGLYVMGSSYFNIVFGFLINIYLMRILAVESYGIYALGVSTAGLIGITNYIGIGRAFSQKGRRDNAAFGTFLGIQFLCWLGTLVLTLPTWFILRALGFQSIVQQVFLVIILIRVLQVVNNSISTMLESDLQFGITTAIDTIAFPLSYIPAVIAAWHGWEAWSLVVQMSAMVWIKTLGLVIALRKHPLNLGISDLSFDRKLAGDYLRFGISLGIISFVQGLSAKLTNLITGKYLGTIALGFFNRADRTARWGGQLLKSLIGKTGFYTLARLKEDHARLSKAFRLMIWFIVNISTPLAGLIVIIAPDLVECLYTRKWLPAAPLLRILAVYTVLSTITSALNNLLVATANQRYLLTRSLLTLGLTLLLAFPLIINWELMGLCLLLGINAVITNVFLIIVMHQKIGISWRIIPLRPIFLMAGIVVLYWSINRHLPVGSLDVWVRLGVKTVAFMAIYGTFSTAWQWGQIKINVPYLKRLIMRKAD